ncbi:MAG TPA: response regulator transcription factor [candidate division Zixibacteria bacterium]|nr:response regulator transcription factor [candidate division Zixibacteria bacterium]
MRLLLVDDDHDVVDSVRLGLQLQWRDIEVLHAGTGTDALRAVEEERPDLVLLDVGLPDVDGYAVLRDIRRFSDVPVIMLTARDQPIDKVRGLEAGADDYVAKPFDHLELFARIKAVLRRLDVRAPIDRTAPFAADGLEVDFSAHEARLNGARLELTPTEFRLLAVLVRNAGWVVPHERLLSQVWGPEYADELDYLRVYIGRLRSKLGDDPDRPRFIRTERGLGYRFVGRGERREG